MLLVNTNNGFQACSYEARDLRPSLVLVGRLHDIAKAIL